ncbi:STYKc [Musa troglodytarum]|uniref:non-specific serine/threonine protein kinase n=1 Tax=Musa troglodytarum TaxID=320322 RepID=A0A9E7KX07_9LILI|nr:STYKc [Musa troglodytarum]
MSCGICVRISEEEEAAQRRDVNFGLINLQQSLSCAGIIVGGAVLIVVAILIIKCVVKTKLRSVSAEEQLPTVTATGSHGSALRKDSTVDMEPIYRFLEDVEKERPMRFTPHHLVHFTNNYAEKLGSGGFGVVYGGRFPNGVKVAVKVLRGTTTSDKRAEERFMAEIGTICRTSHANLVRLYGFCFDKITRALVYEYMEKGSLDQYLFNHKDRIEWGKLREIAIGAAKAIRYLHEEHEQKVVHYDIKPGNILLDADFTPRVSDLGLAKLCDRGDAPVTLTGARGTPGYAAPELWMPLPVTHKCDVYSFGMVLFEILGRRRNLDVRRGEGREWYPRWAWQKHEQGDLEGVISDSSGVQVPGQGQDDVQSGTAVRAAPPRKQTFDEQRSEDAGRGRRDHRHAFGPVPLSFLLECFEPNSVESRQRKAQTAEEFSQAAVDRSVFPSHPFVLLSSLLCFFFPLNNHL